MSDPTILNKRELNAHTNLHSEVKNSPTKYPPRNPFAPPGVIGNRWITYGSDGPIPAKYCSKVDKAIELAYQLVSNKKFVEVFRETVSKLIRKDFPRDVYFDSLDNMIIHLAEASTEAKVKEFLTKEAESIKKDNTYQQAPAFTIPVGGRNVYLREFQLRKEPKVIASSLMHEAAHVAGAPGALLAEIALEALHNVG